jgi:NNP family nitrate/nitrite transporter-like MFS transporter
MHPGTSYTTFMIVACFAGVGGGNFASSMTNINAFFPERHKGWALGLNAGGGNIGVPVIQLLALLVIATAGAGHPRIILAVYIPLIVVAATLSALFMDNLSSVRNDTGAFQESIRENHTWIMAFLYIGTFGSFIGYSFAFGLVLQNQFGRTPLQAAAITFIGPLLGSLIRPVGGKLADRYGGAKGDVRQLRRDGRRLDGDPHGVCRDVPGDLRRRLHRAVRPDRRRQRIHLQDDPGDLPREGVGGDRQRR